MPAIGSLAVATDIASAALEMYVRGDALLQTQQERPLLAFLNAGKETFPGGKQYISNAVQGAVMNDTAGFFAGYTQDDALSFTQAANILRAQVAWKEVHAGFVITHTELKQDGVSVTDGESSTSQHSESFLTQLVSILKNRLDDFAESWARALNEMLWKDGTQDAKQVPGVRSLLLDDPTSGTVAGLSQTTYTWWRSRANLTLAPSAQNQSITKFLRNEILQLQRYGGRPNKILCGSAFWDAIMQEVDARGIYTQTGFAGKTTDIGLRKIAIEGIGLLEYDPTLDTLGLAKYCFVFDSRRIKYRPMEGEENKTMAPARPYNYMVMLKSMTNTAGLTVTQLNAQAVYAIA
jgi:hypothetical protein